VYVDESGDHGLASIDPEFPVFMLSFCIFRKDTYANFVSRLQSFKFKYFGHDIVVLHEHDIRKSQDPFTILFDKDIRHSFMSDLTDIIKDAPFSLFAVAINKSKLKKSDIQPNENPYHIALEFGLLRLESWMDEHQQASTITHLVFESRGKREDNELELEFRRICDEPAAGQQPLPFKIIIANKQINSCGLQLADLTARPIARHVLNPEQTNRAYDTLKEKLTTESESPMGWAIRHYP